LSCLSLSDLHSVWDNNLIAKALRKIPRNYTRPIPLPIVEGSLRGAIYDPYIRRIIWEGTGHGKGDGRWEAETDSWLSCHASQTLLHAQGQPPQEVLARGGGRRPKKGSFPPGTSDSDTLCPHAWAAPVHALNCDMVWPPELDNPPASGWWAPRGPRGDYLELDTPEYAGRIEEEWVIEKLLAMAGVRLAGILNNIFLPELQSQCM
jgi:hypothetical protein